MFDSLDLIISGAAASIFTSVLWWIRDHKIRKEWTKGCLRIDMSDKFGPPELFLQLSVPIEEVMKEDEILISVRSENITR